MSSAAVAGSCCLCGIAWELLTAYTCETSSQADLAARLRIAEAEWAAARAPGADVAAYKQHSVNAAYVMDGGAAQRAFQAAGGLWPGRLPAPVDYPMPTDAPADAPPEDAAIPCVLIP